MSFNVDRPYLRQIDAWKSTFQRFALVLGLSASAVLPRFASHARGFAAPLLARPSGHQAAPLFRGAVATRLRGIHSNSFMHSTIYLTSSSFTYGPAGRHIPTLNRASDTPFTYATLVSEVSQRHSFS